MVHRLLDAIPELPIAGEWWEPAAGEGDIIRVVLRRRPAVRMVASEIDGACTPFLNAAGCDEVRIADAFTLFRKWAGRFRVIVTNPPFDGAERWFAELVRQNPRAWIILLQRVNFLAGSERSAFFRRYAPDVYVSPERPRFEYGRSDQTEYGWYVFPPEEHADEERQGRRRGSIEVMEPTPIAIRRALDMERDAWRRRVLESAFRRAA